MNSISVSKISSKGQIVLPKSIREKFGMNDEVVFIQRGDEIILRKSTDIIEDLEYAQFVKNSFETLKEYENSPESFNSMDKEMFLSELKKW